VDIGDWPDYLSESEREYCMISKGSAGMQVKSAHLYGKEILTVTHKTTKKIHERKWLLRELWHCLATSNWTSMLLKETGYTQTKKSLDTGTKHKSKVLRKKSGGRIDAGLVEQVEEEQKYSS
jgi:hypothetical protein